ncbi:hydrogenase [Sulfurospirillum diekertiae]|uniref:Hydrogenase n=1 Tax=Sulfurospirillum diekertiae TaxID=1854492 RepID=A0A290HE57_9BACT|nr:hydrogenase [Sulfurospirillum diekertiae]ATB69511.1 cytoplasmic uptake NiFe hydrogenase small subunit [Sulfurospirillum diekertiae]QIR77144.1 hydrogenase [Sulfurospirillum diekertiae]QIR79759.1 hydrogenase [Sulfurospirillum diekertiae]
MKHKSTIVWLQGLTCNGNSHSFLNYPQMPSFASSFEMIYHPLICGAQSFSTVLESNEHFDFLIIEGALSHDERLLQRFGIPFYEILDNFAKRAKHIICAGSCASFGGIFRLRDPEKITGALFSGKEKGGYWLEKSNVVNIPGCPLHPRWLVETLFALRDRDTLLLDEFLRPKEVFAYLAHHGCLRNEYFEWKVDSKQLGEKEGCLFYEHGCQGPMSHANCNKILWNGVSSKTRAGSPCLGCTEFDFPRRALFETQKNMSLPQTPFGISKRAYYTVAGVAKSFKIERLEKKLIDENH